MTRSDNVKIKSVIIKNRDEILNSTAYTSPNTDIKTRPAWRLPVWALIIIDVLIAALILSVFSYFHLGIAGEEEGEPMVMVTPVYTPSPAPDYEPAETEPNGEVPEPTIDPANMTWAQKFAEHFTETVVVSENAYSSPNVSITIEKMTKGEGREQITYYVANIYISKIECFQTYLAKGKYGSGKEEVLDMHIASGALLAMSGDYYNSANSTLRNVVIRNGHAYKVNNTSLEVCVLYYDGVMETFGRKEFNDKDVRAAAEERGIWQAWTFGPSFLDDEGKARESFKNVTPYQMKEHPRAAIGYYEPGHYCFVVVDGRQTGYSKGVSPFEFAEIFEELGCKVAYNLDGGGSAMMTYDEKLVNQALSGGNRDIGDCLIIVEVE